MTDDRSLLCRITRGKAQGCKSPLVPRINGQPVAFKGLAGFIAGPALIWSALNPASTLARMAAGTVGVLVTLIDGGHVIRYVRHNNRAAAAAPVEAPAGPSSLALIAGRR